MVAIYPSGMDLYDWKLVLILLFANKMWMDALGISVFKLGCGCGLRLGLKWSKVRHEVSRLN